MLVGLPEVKPDRMIRRFAAAALGRPRETAVSVDEARDLVLGAAARLGVSPRALDNAIWTYQSRPKSRQAVGTKEALNG
jgi:FMN phosphatase YigB (HAD superfamily)